MLSILAALLITTAPSPPPLEPCQVHSAIVSFSDPEHATVKVNFVCNEPYRIVVRNLGGTIKRSVEFSDYGSRGDRTISFPVSKFETDFCDIDVLPVLRARKESE